MDPLSIAASVVSFIDIAKRIKESVDKIGQNRQTLKELTSDVIGDLTELQKICQHRSVTDQPRLDYDSADSLKKLQSELNNVLERCLRILERRNRKRKRLCSLKTYVSMWIKNAKLEADILRLRDRVSSVHRRFTYITSLRMEHNLLVVSTETRTRMGRMEGLVAQLLIDSHTTGTNPARLLDDASPNGIEFQFLRLQVKKVVDRLGHISATRGFMAEEPLEAEPLLSHCYVDGPQQQASLMRSTMIMILDTLQLFEDSSGVSFREGVSLAMAAYNLLMDLDMVDEAAAVTTWVIAIYRTMTQEDPTYMPYVVDALLNLSGIHAGTLEGLDAAKSALSACRSMVSTSQQDSLTLAACLRNYADHLVHHDQYDPPVEYAMEALQIQRKAPDSWQGENSIVWDSSGEERVVFSSARSITRSFHMAVEEGFTLYTLANALAYVGRYTEAAIVGNEVINCLSALAEVGCSSVDPYIVEVLENRIGWVSIIEPPTSSNPPFASISDSEHPNTADEIAIEGFPSSANEISTSTSRARGQDIIMLSSESPSTTDSMVHPASPPRCIVSC